MSYSVRPKRVIESPLRFFQARILQFETIHSTNTFLKEEAQRLGYDNINPKIALCAVADEQTAGRGRMDRSWHSPRGEGLYFSILLKPEIATENAPMLTLMAGVAAAETVGAKCSGAVDIKWPNDILVDKRKVAGILTEAGLESEELSYAVIGFGVNLNQRSFPEEIRDSATSLFCATGREFSRDDFMLDLLARVDEWYGVLLSSPQRITLRWMELSSFAKDKSILVERNGIQIHARTCGLNSSGALCIRTEDGLETALYGGEIVTSEVES